MKDRIKEVRKSQGLSQTEFAQMMGLTRGVISNIEGGIVEPKDYVIELICKTFKINRSWLDTGEGEMYCPDMDDVLSLLAQKYHMDDRRMAIVRAYLQLSEDQQMAVLAYAEGVADCLRNVVDDEERRYEEATGAVKSRRNQTGSEERKA